MRRKQKGEKRNGPSRLNFLGLHSFISWKEPHVMNSGLKHGPYVMIYSSRYIDDRG